MVKPSFVRSGFEYARCGTFEGWLSRDGENGQWIIWDMKTACMYRGFDSDALRWLPSGESMDQCIRLGAAYAKKQAKRS